MKAEGGRMKAEGHRMSRSVLPLGRFLVPLPGELPRRGKAPYNVEQVPNGKNLSACGARRRLMGYAKSP